MIPPDAKESMDKNKMGLKGTLGVKDIKTCCLYCESDLMASPSFIAQ